jgi:hypothetical protein
MKLPSIPDRWVVPLFLAGWAITLLCILILTAIAIMVIHNCPS